MSEQSDARSADRLAGENFDLVGPFRGPCGLCGGPDARHRLYDAVAERVAAGEDEDQVARDYDEGAQWVLAIVADAKRAAAERA